MRREVNKFLSHWYKRKLSSVRNKKSKPFMKKSGAENGLYQANRLLERLKAIYNKAIWMGWGGTNPAKAWKNLKKNLAIDFFIRWVPNFLLAWNRGKWQKSGIIFTFLFNRSQKIKCSCYALGRHPFNCQEWLIPELEWRIPWECP